MWESRSHAGRIGFRRRGQASGRASMAILLQLRAFLPDRFRSGWIGALSGLHARKFDALSVRPMLYHQLRIQHADPNKEFHTHIRRCATTFMPRLFDYETELFVPVEDGEFVLISNGNEAIQPIVLPGSARFATRRDFYELYQDYYHCAEPDAGEVHIIQPAAVVHTAAGWKLQARGILEVLEDQPKKKASADATCRKVDTSAREEPELSIVATKEGSPVTPCAHCGYLVETRYAFCWNCGNSLKPQNESSVTRSEGIIPSPARATEDEELTVEHDVSPVGSPMFLC